MRSVLCSIGIAGMTLFAVPLAVGLDRIVEARCNSNVTGRATPQPASARVSRVSAVAEKPSLSMNCSVVSWKVTGQKPTLTLACSNKKKDPVQVYMKLSWMEDRDRPCDYDEIVAPAGTSTQVRSVSTGVRARLPMRGEGKERSQLAWVSFNELVDLKIVSQN